VAWAAREEEEEAEASSPGDRRRRVVRAWDTLRRGGVLGGLCARPHRGPRKTHGVRVRRTLCYPGPTCQTPSTGENERNGDVMAHGYIAEEVGHNGGNQLF